MPDSLPKKRFYRNLLINYYKAPTDMQYDPQATTERHQSTVLGVTNP